MNGNLFLLGSEPREIDAGKFTGSVGMLQEDFSGVLKRFHFGVDGQAEERANLRIIERGIAKADMFLDDAAL